MKTLLLSATYFPLRILDWEDAIKMRYEGTAEVLAEYQDTVSSPSCTWRVPAVMRVQRPVRVKRRVRFSPRNIFIRDDFTCQYCGVCFPERELECEHVVPKSRGGQKTWENIVAACRKCNAKKADRGCDECGMFPINAPKRPTWLPLIPRVDPARMPQEWRQWIPA